MLGSPAFRESVRAELATATTFRLFNGEWDKVQVVETSISAHARYEQQTIADIEAKLGRPASICVIPAM